MAGLQFNKFRFKNYKIIFTYFLVKSNLVKVAVQ